MVCLSVQIDGFEQDKKVVFIAATNRKQDLDPALIRLVGAHSPLQLTGVLRYVQICSNFCFIYVISVALIQ